MIWWIVPGAVALFGLVVFGTGLARLFKVKMMTGGVRLLAGGGVLAVAGLLSVVGLNLQTYSRLTHERLVATVDLTQNGPQDYTANVTLAEEVEATSYSVLGDELRMEARVLKWTPWANIVGYDAVYKLDRLSGRYADLEDEQTRERSVHGLSNNPGLDVFKIVRDQGGLMGSVDAYYGSGTYVPMIDQAQYNVFMTQNGLITRAANETATEGLREWGDANAAPVVVPTTEGS